MGNCQAIDAAMLVIQHPNGKEDKLYWPVTASEIMKANPNHYVALLITSTLCPSADGKTDAGGGGGGVGDGKKKSNSGGMVRVTRVKVLRPTDTLALGQVYRLISSQEVMRGLRAKKQAKMMKKKSESEAAGDRGGNAKEKEESGFESFARGSEKDKQAIKHEKHRQPPAAPAAAKARAWQPSLQSISEAWS